MKKAKAKNKSTSRKEKPLDNPSNAQLTEETLNEGDSVDQIRDILFGAQVRKYEQKFDQLEEIIKKEVSSLGDNTRKTIETLENYTKKELSSIVAQLKDEKTERSESFNELSKSLDKSNKTLEKKINRLVEKTSKDQSDLQEQILQQSKNLMKEIQKKNDEITAILKKSVEELRNEKTDRIALGNLFNELGLRLKEEFKIPKGN